MKPIKIASAFGPDQFRTAKRSKEGGTDCVAVARGLGWVIVRDDKQTFGSDTDHQFCFPVAEFDAFQDKVRASDLRTVAIPAEALHGSCIAIVRRGENVNVLTSTIEQAGVPAGAELVFDDAEVIAFLDGVHEREFDVDSGPLAYVAA